MKTELTMDGGVLITGGATGIGFAFARKFHSAGNRVIIVGRSENALSKAANSLSGIETGVADVSVASDRERLVAEFPDISILVNNAGLQVIAPNHRIGAAGYRV